MVTKGLKLEYLQVLSTLMMLPVENFSVPALLKVKIAKQRRAVQAFNVWVVREVKRAYKFPFPPALLWVKHAGRQDLAAEAEILRAEDIPGHEVCVEVSGPA